MLTIDLVDHFIKIEEEEGCDRSVDTTRPFRGFSTWYPDEKY